MNMGGTHEKYSKVSQWRNPCHSPKLIRDYGLAVSLKKRELGYLTGSSDDPIAMSKWDHGNNMGSRGGRDWIGLGHNGPTPTQCGCCSWNLDGIKSQITDIEINMKKTRLHETGVSWLVFLRRPCEWDLGLVSPGAGAAQIEKSTFFFFFFVCFVSCGLALAVRSLIISWGNRVCLSEAARHRFLPNPNSYLSRTYHYSY